MTQSQTKVRYNHIPLSSRLEQLVGNNLRSDFTFLIEDDKAKIPAHKLIIALASPVLDRIVYGNESFPPSDFIKVNGISSESFMEILHFIYTDTITINDDNVFEILHKSNFFGLPGIEVKCLEYLEEHLNVTTVPWIFHQLFHTVEPSHLMKKCLLYLRIRPLEFFASQYFEKITFDEMKVILQMDAINCSEIDLFEAVIKLSKEHCAAVGLDITAENQRKVLDGTENLLRLESISESEFEKCREIQKDFYSSSEIEKIREGIRSSGPAVSRKRKWYTYDDAVWIETARAARMPPSACYCETFIFRRSKDDEEPQIASRINELSALPGKVEVLCGSGYSWQKCVNGMIPFSSVPISPKLSEPVFIARGSSSHRGLTVAPAYMNGKLIVRPYPPSSNYMDFQEGDEELSDFEILVAKNVKHPYTERGVPNDAIFVGYDEETDSKIYLGRAWSHGDLLPAKVNVGLESRIFVPYNTTAILVDDYEFVRMDPGTYRWIKAMNGEVPANSVIGGCTSVGETLYFGRVLLDSGNYIPGKVHPSHGVMYAARGQIEINFSSYEVLVHNES